MSDAEPSSSRSSSRALVWALLGALALVAFLLGRESMRWGSTPAEVAAPAPIVVEAPSPPPAPATETRSPFDDPPRVVDIGSTVYGGEARIEERPDGRIVLSNAGSASASSAAPPSAAPPQAPTPTTAAATESDDYFERMDAIRAGQDMGDPNAFALDVVRAAMSGSTAGIESLVEDTENIQQQMEAVTPPPEYAAYHQASIETIAEGRELLEELERSLKEQDISGLTSIAPKARALQAKTEQLRALERHLRPPP